MMIASNKIICRDALDGLSTLRRNTVDLLYMDPPFFSNRNFQSISKHGKKLSFDDRWKGGLQSYLDFMRPILQQCKRVLRNRGSLYLHCDWHASHYLKIELDNIFGYKNFRNEIIWIRHNGHNDAKQGSRFFGRIHDVIFFYSKTNNYTWIPYYDKYPSEYVNKNYRYVEPETGRRYALGDLSGPGGASKGNPYFEFLGITRHWRYNKTKMLKLYKNGKIIQRKPGTVPLCKRYLDEMKGLTPQDVWDDVISAQVGRTEMVGYPTQKPIRLLERIIEVSTKPKQLVIDPFCGSGTTLVAAHNLGRKWIGFDINPDACSLARDRIHNLIRNRESNPQLVAVIKH